MVNKLHRLNTKSATLTPHLVLQMRRDYASGMTQGQCAKQYGISVGQVGRIVRGEAWMQVPEVPTNGDLGLTGLLDQERTNNSPPARILNDPEGNDIAESIRRTKELLGENNKTESRNVLVGRQGAVYCRYCQDPIFADAPEETVVIINDLPAHKKCAVKAGDIVDG